MLYGKESWASKAQHINKISVVELRRLRLLCGHTRLENVRNKHISEMMQVALIEFKLKEGDLRWFDHVLHKPLNAPVHRCNDMMIDGAEKG